MNDGRVSNVPLGPHSATFTCPLCQTVQTTTVKNAPSMKTHFMAALLCIFGCCFCAPCVYCTDSCLMKNHFCGNCEQYIGRYEN